MSEATETLDSTLHPSSIFPAAVLNSTVKAQVTIPDAFSSERKSAAMAKGYDFISLAAHHLTDLMLLQDVVMRTLSNKDWLRANTAEMLEQCLSGHVSVGVQKDGELVAAAVLYDAKDTKESIRGYFTDDAALLHSSVNLKLVLASPHHRGVGLGRTLVEMLSQHATLVGKSEIACTIHPDNTPSQTLFTRIGYQHIGDINASYGARRVYAQSL